jgi:4-amino-4-deoxy-L-arabinose transferase-like glycosyltransferase
MSLFANPQQNSRYLGLFLFLLALVLRLSYVNTVEVDEPFRADAGKYVTLAANTVYEHSYSVAASEPYVASTYITPGYPLFLAAVMNFVADREGLISAVLNLQALLGSVTVLLIYAMALRLLPLAFAGTAGLLVALSPHLIASSGYFLTETLFTFYLVLAAWLSVQALQHKQLSWFVLAGMVAALGALTRPVLALYPLVVVLLLWRFSARTEWLKLSAAVVVGFALLWSPWQLWKSQNFNADEPSLGPASFALGIYPDLIYKDPEMRGRPYADDLTYNSFSTSYSATWQVLKERAAQEPAQYLQWYAFGKAAMYWQPSNTVAAVGGPFIYPIITSRYHKSDAWRVKLVAMFNLHTPLVLLSLLAGVVSLVAFCRQQVAYQEVCLFSGVLAYFTLVHMVLTPLPRYSYPVIPIAYLMGCYGLYWLVNYVKQWRTQRATA